MGVALGILSLVCAVAGERLVTLVFPDPPPPILQNKDSGPLTAADMAAAAAEYAGYWKGELSRRLEEKGYGDETKCFEDAYESSARRLRRWVKMAYGEEAADEDAESGVSRDDREPSSPASGVGVGEADVGGGASWRGWSGHVTVDFSGRTERQKWLAGVFRDVGLFGGIAALVLGVLAWVRREDSRAAVAAGILGGLGMLWSSLSRAAALLLSACML